MASPDVPSGNVGTMMVLSSGEIVVLVAGELSDSDSGFSLCYITTTAGSTQNVFAEQDANDNTTSLTDSSGTVLQRFEYAPYGAATALTPSWSSTTDAYNWIYGYQGGRLDSATGLINLRHRDYSASLGRWLQPDPAGYVDGASLYQFVRSDATKLFDPSGLGAMTDAETMIVGSESYQIGYAQLISTLDKKVRVWATANSGCGNAEDQLVYAVNINGAVYDRKSLLYNLYHQLTIGSFTVMVNASAPIVKNCAAGTVTADWTINFTCVDPWHLHTPLWDPTYWRVWQWRNHHVSVIHIQCHCCDPDASPTSGTTNPTSGPDR
jgi:RHS repeat-associated protein